MGYWKFVPFWAVDSFNCNGYLRTQFGKIVFFIKKIGLSLVIVSWWKLCMVLPKYRGTMLNSLFVLTNQCWMQKLLYLSNDSNYKKRYAFFRLLTPIISFIVLTSSMVSLSFNNKGLLFNCYRKTCFKGKPIFHELKFSSLIPWTATYLSLTCFQLVEHDSEGQCNSECKTIERACQEVSFGALLS